MIRQIEEEFDIPQILKNEYIEKWEKFFERKVLEPSETYLGGVNCPAIKKTELSGIRSPLKDDILSRKKLCLIVNLGSAITYDLVL